MSTQRRDGRAGQDRLGAGNERIDARHQVAIHPLLGLTLAAATVWLLVRRRFSPGALGQAALAILGAGLALGIVVLVVGATTPYRRLVDAHVAVSAVGAALLLLYFWRAASTAHPNPVASGFS